MEIQLRRRMDNIDQCVKELVLMMRQMKIAQQELFSFNNDDDSLNEVQQAMKKEIVTNSTRKILQRSDDYITKLNQRVTSVLQHQKEESGTITGSQLNSKDAILHSLLPTQILQQQPILRSSQLGSVNPSPFQLPFRFQTQIPLQNMSDASNPLAPYTFPPSYVKSNAIESQLIPPYMEYSFVIPEILTRIFSDQQMCFKSPVFSTQPFPFKWRLHVYPRGIIQAKQQQQQFIIDDAQNDKEKDNETEEQNKSANQSQPVRISTVNKITNEIQSGFVNAENLMSVFVELVEGFSPEMISQAIKYFPPAVPASEYIQLDQKRTFTNEQQSQQQLNQENVLNIRQIDNIYQQQYGNQNQIDKEKQNQSMKGWQNAEDDLESELSEFHKMLRDEGKSNFSEISHPHFFDYKIQLLCEDPTLTSSQQRTQTFEGSGIFNCNNPRGQEKFITHKQLGDDNFLWRGDESAHFVFGVRFPSYKRESESLRLILMQYGSDGKV